MNVVSCLEDLSFSLFDSKDDVHCCESWLRKQVKPYNQA